MNGKPDVNNPMSLQNMPGAKNIDRMSYWIEAEVSCEDGYQAVGSTCGM